MHPWAGLKTTAGGGQPAELPNRRWAACWATQPLEGNYLYCVRVGPLSLYAQALLLPRDAPPALAPAMIPTKPSQKHAVGGGGGWHKALVVGSVGGGGGPGLPQHMYTSNQPPQRDDRLGYKTRGECCLQLFFSFGPLWGPNQSHGRSSDHHFTKALSREPLPPPPPAG